MRVPRLALTVAFILLVLPASPALVAAADDPAELALPASELGPNWSITPGSERRTRVAKAQAYLVEYQNRADYPSPRRVKLDLRVFPDAAEAEALLAGFRNVGIWKPMSGLGDGTALYTTGPAWEGSGRYAGSIYWFRVGHVAAHVEVLGLPDPQEIDAQARHLAQLQEDRLRQRLGLPGPADRAPGLAALPTPSARLIVNDCERSIADVTIPDATQVAPGQTFSKVWRVANCGDTAWEGYRAVRVGGNFGPESFEVPSTPPGAEVDIAVTMRAPPIIGEYTAMYQLLGPGYPFGGFTAVIDVADCNRHPEVTAQPGAEVSARTLILGNSSLPDGWCLVSEEHEGRWSMMRFNSAAYGAPRRAQVWASVWPSDAYAEQALLGFLKGALITEDPNDFRPTDGAPWEIEGVPGQHWTWTNRRAGFVGADYAFRLGPVIGWVQASGAPAAAAELDTFAQTLARAQWGKVRTALSSAAPAPSFSSPSPAAVYSALQTTPFTADELPSGLQRTDLQWLDSDDARLVGSVRLLAWGPNEGDKPDGMITYRVYSTVGEAEAAYKAFAGFAYIYLPRTISSPARCSSGGALQNACAVLAGNVVIVSDARQVDEGFGSATAGTPAGLTAVGMARAGLAHLERTLGGLPWSEP